MTKLDYVKHEMSKRGFYQRCYLLGPFGVDSHYIGFISKDQENLRVSFESTLIKNSTLVDLDSLMDLFIKSAEKQAKDLQKTAKAGV